MGDPMAALSITDAVVIAAHDDGPWADGGPAGDPPVQLLPDLRLMRLPSAEAQAFQQACESRHLNYNPVGEGGGHRYAFVRHPAPAASLQTLHGFDPDDVIHTALALSRYLVRNSHCTEVAARRVEGLRPHPVVITAVLPENRFYAWRVIDGSRAYLTQEDAHRLGPLLATLLRDRDRMPPRVWNAIWFCEASFRTYYYDVASVHVVTALESLLKVGRRDATAQFATRVPALAREVGIIGTTRRQAEAFYGRRSRSVHGRRLAVSRFAPATRDLAAMQQVLMVTLQRAIEDRRFRAMFTGPRIEARWPTVRRRR